jgi:hypothetical protein
LNIENNELILIIFEMSSTEEIAAVKAELADLKQELTSESFSEQKELVIRQQIIATQYTFF